MEFELKPVVLEAVDGDGNTFFNANFNPPVVEPRPVDQPIGTEVRFAFRGASTIEVGGDVRVFPGDFTARVRSLEVHGEAREQVRAGRRCAIALVGVERLLERIGIARLRQVVSCTELDRLDSRGDGAVAGQDDGADRRQALDEVGQDLEPLLAAQAEVDHGVLGAMDRCQAKRGAMVRGPEHLVAAVDELELHRLAEGVVVVDHKVAGALTSKAMDDPGSRLSQRLVGLAPAVGGYAPHG